MKSWKRAEKEVARYFKGMRRVRVSYSDSIGDIIHPTLSIEVKYGEQIPKYCRVEVPTSIVVRNKQVYSLYPANWMGNRRQRWVHRKSAVFLEKAFAQAKKYDPTKTPIVCMKPPRWRGFVVCRFDANLTSRLRPR